MNQKALAHCPICNCVEVKSILQTKDYSLTNEQFDILECAKCSLKYTNPIPGIDQIGPYYSFTAYISHTDINVGWMNRLYHLIRNRTLLQKSNWVQSLFTGHKGHLLEVGAGTGAFAYTMKSKGWEITALEPNEASRNIAAEKYQLTILSSETLYQLPALKFDAITLWHVLEHVHELKEYLAVFHKILKQNGRLIIAVPNPNSFDASFYKHFWAAYDVPRHLYHFTPKSMQTLCAQFDLQIVSKKPMWFDSYYVSLLSEKYKNSGYWGVLRAFIIGCISNLKAIKDPEKASSIIYEIKRRGL